MNRFSKKQLLILAGGLVAITLFAVYQLFIVGRVTIVTNSDTAEVHYIDAVTGENVPAGSGKRVTIKASAGEYTVLVTDGNKETWKTVAVPRFFKGEDVPVELVEVVSPIEEYPLFVQSLAYDNETLRYLARSGAEIIEQNLSANTYTNLTQDHPLIREIVWANYNSAFVIDQLGTARWFNNGTLTTLKGLPDSLPVGLSYDINTQREIAITYNGQLYFYDSPLSEPRVIAKGISTGAIIDLADNGAVLLYELEETGGDAPNLDSEALDPLADTPPQQMIIYLADGQTRTISAPTSAGPLAIAELNPTATGIFYQAGNALYVHSVDGDTRLVLSHIPNLIHKVVWRGENVLFHAKNSVWSYSPTNNSLHRLSEDIKGVAASQSFFVTDSTVLFSVKDEKFARGKIYRVNLAD